MKSSGKEYKTSSEVRTERTQTTTRDKIQTRTKRTVQSSPKPKEFDKTRARKTVPDNGSSIAKVKDREQPAS
jgi:gamma-tubulin complex component 2